MNISQINYPYITYTNNTLPHANKTDGLYKETPNYKLNFKGSYAESEIRLKQTSSKQRRERIKEINVNEYYEIMNDLIENRSDINSRFIPNNYFIDKSYCSNIPFEFMGVIPYCGYEDCNKHINDYISGSEKLATEEKEEENARFISALNYSLDRIDEKYGKFEGFVYRMGDFSPVIQRYYSTSEHASYDGYIYSNLENRLQNNKELNFNIIKVKNGHRLNSMLNEYAESELKELAQEEDEILIDANSKFRYVPETKYDEEIINIKNDYYNNIIKGLNKNNTEEELNKKIKISVWEEI